ncbi:methyltransferase domain-containing protein [Christiangramia sp.]|uniref:methyltransferase domain-containing protein n=1 Tax=Christiangramia sp. TaxID=1931228 RepID=UPI00260808AE|nr:methyltransferase domain-containing protein [Christiangramia sp.]
MFKIDTSYRSKESEIMDDFDLMGNDLRRTLKDLENINAWLGGNQITIDGIKKLISECPKSKKISIADIGCGNGAMLRKIAKWAESKNYNFELTGIDANAHAVQIATELSENQTNLKFLDYNIFSKIFKEMEFDIILCTLTLHHFKDREIMSLIKQLSQQSRLGVVVNDLQRSSSAYFLFKAFCAVFVHNKIARKDGLISILRGFKKEDIKKFALEIPAENHEISWKWAFRYQWIIKKNH